MKGIIIIILLVILGIVGFSFIAQINIIKNLNTEINNLRSELESKNYEKVKVVEKKVCLYSDEFITNLAYDIINLRQKVRDWKEKYVLKPCS